MAEVRIFPNEANRLHRGRWSAEVLGVKAKVPRGGIKARLLRKVPLGEHLRFAGQFLREVREQYGDLPFKPDRSFRARGFVAPEKTNGMRAGRKGRSDIFYARLARDYVKAIERGSKRPVEKIAKARNLPKERVRDMLHAARKRGLLTRGFRGHSVGELTEKGRKLLEKRKP